MASHKSNLNRQEALKSCHSFGRICPINNSSSSSKAAKTGHGCSSSTFTATCSMDEGCGVVGACSSGDLQAPVPAVGATTTVVDLNDVDGTVGGDSAEAVDEKEGELLVKTTDNKLSALFKGGNLSVDGHLRNRLQHAPQALCHSADCIDGQYPDASNGLCPLCGRAATLVRRPMSPSSDARNAIYEVSNDFIKLFGSKRQYGLLLSGPVDLATPDQQSSHYPSRLSSDKSDQQLLQSGPAATIQTAPLMPRPPGNYLLPKRKSAYGVLWKDKQNWRQKLRTRKRLFYQRNKVCDLCLLFALAGILITVLEAELTSHQFLLKCSIVFIYFMKDKQNICFLLEEYICKKLMKASGIFNLLNGNSFEWIVFYVVPIISVVFVSVDLFSGAFLAVEKSPLLMKLELLSFGCLVNGYFEANYNTIQSELIAAKKIIKQFDHCLKMKFKVHRLWISCRDAV
ncbi:conserved hypothetical protein [Trichinella spiralis]|uniref:hypothetical protein n=1 Tax=Trichinella spiralis TaxID=6334 RepID=UPI0001EFB46D|nr:conserved hypothetical protein [Trichinella spiralis]